MLRQIYELKAKDGSIPLTERKQAADEAALLDPDLRNIEQMFTRPEESEDILGEGALEVPP